MWDRHDFLLMEIYAIWVIGWNKGEREGTFYEADSRDHTHYRVVFQKRSLENYYKTREVSNMSSNDRF